MSDRTIPMPPWVPPDGIFDDEDVSDESDFCECNEQPMMEESDWNKCFSCGKPLS